jgi:hypothetical protein
MGCPYVVAVQLKVKCNANVNVLVHLPSFWVGKGFDAGENTMVRLRPNGACVLLNRHRVPLDPASDAVCMHVSLDAELDCNGKRMQ